MTERAERLIIKTEKTHYIGLDANTGNSDELEIRVVDGSRSVVAEIIRQVREAQGYGVTGVEIDELPNEKQEER